MASAEKQFDLAPYLERGKPVWLEIGCGKSPQRDYIGVDRSPNVGALIVGDMECERLPLPDNSVDKILWRFSLEHVRNVVHALGECWRVLKPTGLMEIIGLPYASNLDSLGNPHHVTHCDEHFFDYFGGERGQESDYGVRFAYEVVEREFVWFPEFQAIPHEQREYARRHLCNSIMHINWLVRPRHKAGPSGERVVRDAEPRERPAGTSPRTTTARLAGTPQPTPAAGASAAVKKRLGARIPRPLTEEVAEEAMKTEVHVETDKGNGKTPHSLGKLAQACLETGRALLEANDGPGAAHAFSALTCISPEAPAGYVGLDGALRTASQRSNVPEIVLSLAIRGAISPAVAEQVLQVIQEQWPDDADATTARRELQEMIATPS